MPRRTKEDDLYELERIAEELAEAQAIEAALISERRAIWHRRTTAGDTTKVELAAASSTTPMNVAAGLRPHLIAKRSRSKAKTVTS